MSHIKRYSRFVEEYVMAGPDTDTETKPDTETETDERPSRPGSLPDQEPNVLPNPLASDTDTETKPDTETETDERPSRPGSLPDQEPNVLPNPLAAAKNVIDRFVDIYNQSSKKEQSDIDSYFKK